MLRRVMWFLVGVLLAVGMVMCSEAVYAATPAQAKIDCKNPKNAKKIQCAKPPTSEVGKKAVLKKPTKVRKADKKVQQKAAENLKK